VIHTGAGDFAQKVQCKPGEPFLVGRSEALTPPRPAVNYDADQGNDPGKLGFTRFRLCWRTYAGDGVGWSLVRRDPAAAELGLGEPGVDADEAEGQRGPLGRPTIAGHKQSLIDHVLAAGGGRTTGARGLSARTAWRALLRKYQRAA